MQRSQLILGGLMIEAVVDWRQPLMNRRGGLVIEIVVDDGC